MTTDIVEDVDHCKRFINGTKMAIFQSYQILREHVFIIFANHVHNFTFKGVTIQSNQLVINVGIFQASYNLVHPIVFEVFTVCGLSQFLHTVNW